MFKLWLKVNEEGVITHTLFGSFAGEPVGFESNFVVEDNAMIAELRNSTKDWYVRDNKLCKKELISLRIEKVKPEGSEDDVIRANGVDAYRVTVQGCSAPEVNLFLGKEKIVLPSGEDLMLTSVEATATSVEARGLEYKTTKPVYLRFR